MPEIQGVMETAVYVDDMDLAEHFYRDVLGLECMFKGDGLIAFDAGFKSALLVFHRDGRFEDLVTPGGTIPGHNSAGHAHFAFRVSMESYERWKQHMAERDIEIISEVTWPAGGLSFYFNDPDGNVLEMATPGNWPNNPL